MWALWRRGRANARAQVATEQPRSVDSSSSIRRTGCVCLCARSNTRRINDDHARVHTIVKTQTNTLHMPNDDDDGDVRLASSIRDDTHFTYEFN